jgi:hypothetical protein
MIGTSLTEKSFNVEQELGEILELLTPPLEILASRLSDFLSNPNLSPEPSTERVLATYFELFAHGFSLWDITYNYDKVHEYFYAGYLKAKKEAGENTPQELLEMLEMLEKFTMAMIAFTWCENAMLCDDPKGLLIASTDTVTYMEEAKRLLCCSSLASRLRSPIEQYCDLYLKNFRGLKLCAEMYLAGLAKEDISISKQREVEQLLSSLEISSPEIASILRAHYIFAQRFSQAQTRRNPDLRIKEGKLLLRAIGYAGEELVKALFDKCKGNKIPKEVCDIAREKSKLKIVSVRGSYMQDIFDTILGDEYFQTIIIELSNINSSSEDSGITFLIRDGEEEIQYSIETFQVYLTYFGSISVDFSISLKRDTSVSHIRVLESLISPHSGRFDFIWRDAPSDSGQEYTNYVDYFLRSQAWVESIRQARHNHQELSIKVAGMDSVLKKWQEQLCKLATWLPRQSTEPSIELTEQVLPEYEFKTHQEKAESPIESVYKALYQECFLCMRDLAHQWIEQAETSSSLAELVQEGKRLFPQGVNCVRFGRLMDIAQEVWKHIERYLLSNLPEGNDASSSEMQTEPNDDFRCQLHFDPNLGWSTILSCNRFILVERDGEKIELTTDWDHQQVFDHPEFKGLIIQSREARAALYDWLFVVTPPYRNLATIRSHKTDMMCITENRTFLYLPDDPIYLVKQYIETSRLLNDLRILVLSFNVIAKGQIKGLESYIGGIERPKNDNKRSLSKYDNSLSRRRIQIEVFRTNAEKILDLLRSCNISKYQDHSDLMKEMIKESRVDNIRDSLEHNIVNLDRFHAYLTERLKRRIDESSEITQRRIETTQRRLNYLVAVLTFLSVLTVIPTILNFFSWLRSTMIGPIGQLSDMIGRGILLAILLGAVGLLRIVVSLLARQKSRKT